MTTINQRHEILESLSYLDQAQAAKVLDYIKGLTYPGDVIRRQRLKREAMKEIRQALGNNRTLNPGF